MNEEEFEKILESLYPNYKASKERARIYFLENKIVKNAPDIYNVEQLHVASIQVQIEDS